MFSLIAFCLIHSNLALILITISTGNLGFNFKCLTSLVAALPFLILVFFYFREQISAESTEPVQLFWKADDKSIHLTDEGNSTSRSFSFGQFYCIYRSNKCHKLNFSLFCIEFCGYFEIFMSY